GILFRTPPPDSTGLPHIMEHSVLGGSRKYPVKEPFVELVKGSLKTFVNALTWPDKTGYPVASQNVKDLYNLIDVYLDAVFYPRITPQALRQEGWHYELDDAAGEMTFKGVVYNEMKGAQSSPEDRVGRHSRMALFPDTSYGLDSGGDPAEIPNLTYEQFKAFHETYYHPSNARLYWYGDDDPQERLRILDAYLRDYDRIDVDSQIRLQPPFEGPRYETVAYDAGEESAKKAYLTLNWLLGENRDPETTLGLNILEHVLIGTPASPLRKALIDSGLGEDLVGRGLNEDSRQMYFSTGLKGIAVDDAQRVETLILDTLAQLAGDGIERDMIDASLNTIEFQLRENNTGRFPRGLALMFRAASTWVHDGDPLAPLAFEAPLQSIKARLAAGEVYFEGLIRTAFLDNSHRATVLLRPDPTVRQAQESAERARLDAARAAMSPDELQRVIAETRELKRMQETPDSPEALATIPVLSLDDLERENKQIPLQVTAVGGATTLYHDLFTNGIVYLDLAFDLHALPQKLLPYVPLFGQALVKIGTETEDFVQLSRRIGRKTGGISPTLLSTSKVGTPQAEARLILRGKATVSQAGDLLDILRDILLTIKLDNQERFKQMVLEAKARKEAALVPGGHGVVHTRLGAQFSEAGWVSEQTGGIEQLFVLRQLAGEVDSDWPALLARLEQIRRILINRNALVCNVTTDGADWPAFEAQLAGFVAALPDSPLPPTTWTPDPLPAFEGLTIPARVNYVAKGANLYRAGYALHGSISVIQNYLRTTWLWERVRVHGGAYGAYLLFDRHDGLLDYLSYRDPNLLATIDNYDGTARFLRELDLSQGELVKSIIGAIGQIDAYQLPDAKGFTSMTRYLIGESEAERQRLREEVLGATTADFRAFADVLERVNSEGHVVVMGSAEAIGEVNAARDNWLEVTRVL
ncbi:MAG: insulinase family protein, partial [Anaerolineae bacterium]|nr:insulinase family protein [Anaerolineae bacterium]